MMTIEQKAAAYDEMQDQCFVFTGADLNEQTFSAFIELYHSYATLKLLRDDRDILDLIDDLAEHIQTVEELKNLYNKTLPETLIQPDTILALIRSLTRMARAERCF